LTEDEAKEWIFEHLPDYVPPTPIGLGAFDKFIFPVIRNVPAPGLIESLVTVQPMAVPSATIFYLDFNRDSWWNRLVRVVKKILVKSMPR
jgi:hypothetical protein